MKNLSIAQEYLLCSLDKKGRISISIMNRRIPICVLLSGLIELLANNCIKIDEKNKVSIVNNLGEEQIYLKSLFDLLKTSKPMKIEKIAEAYIMKLKRLNELVTDIGNSLADMGCVAPEKGGILGNKMYFIPNSLEVDKVIQKIRAELLESGTMSDETIVLVSLLDKSNQLKQYFSKYELEELKARMKEIKKDPSNQMAKQMIAYVDKIMAMIAVIASIPH